MGKPGRAILCQHTVNKIVVCGERPELKHLSRGRKRHQPRFCQQWRANAEEAKPEVIDLWGSDSNMYDGIQSNGVGKPTTECESHVDERRSCPPPVSKLIRKVQYNWFSSQIRIMQTHLFYQQNCNLPIFRRSKLHIVRFRASSKAHSFRCFSSQI